MKLMRLLLLLLLLGSIATSVAFAAPLTPDDYHDDETDTSDEEETDDTDETDQEDEDEKEDSDNDGIDDETELKYEREVEVEEGDREWKIESQLKNGEDKDEFEAEFKIGGGDEPEIELEYSTEAGSSESEMKYRVNFDELIEFTDDGTAGYQEDSDTVESVYELDKADWDAIVYSTDVLDGSTVYTATASTSDGLFTLVLKLSTGFAEVNSTIVTPNAIKIDVIIDGYNYTGTNTYLTLQTDIKSQFETEVEEESEDEASGFASNETQVSVASTSAEGFFSWVKTAEADGSTIDVISSTLQEASDDDDDLEEGEDHKILFFTFDALNPDRIVWDPKVGVNNSAFIAGVFNNSTSDGLPLSFWIILVTLAVPVWYRRRE